MAIKVGRGRAEVTITGALAADLERDFRRLLGPVADAMQAEADAIIKNEIKPSWPIKSGKSRAGWATLLRVDPSSSIVEIVLSNPERYVRYISSTKVGKKADSTRVRSPLVAHVRKPAAKARRVLAKRTLPALLAAGIQSRFDDAS